MATQKIKTRTMTKKNGKSKGTMRSSRLKQNGKNYNLTKLAARRRLKVIR